MMNEMTICQCCEAISELTHDETINEILNYIETKATHMNNKLVEYKESSLTLEELDYEIVQTKYCIKDGEYLFALRSSYLSEFEKANINKSIDVNKSILNKLEKQKEILENESKKETSRD